MSLVNYSSDEDDDEEKDAEEEKQEEEEAREMSEALQQKNPTVSSFRPPSVSSSAAMETRKPRASFHNSNTPPAETSLKLPDASQLLASSDSGRKISAVNVSGSGFLSTKRSEPNGSAGNGPPKKIPKGTLTASRINPDTAGGSLLPPQLKGRSNVATEDLDKLFTRRRSA